MATPISVISSAILEYVILDTRCQTSRRRSAIKCRRAIIHMTDIYRTVLPRESGRPLRQSSSGQFGNGSSGKSRLIPPS